MFAATLILAFTIPQCEPGTSPAAARSRSGAQRGGRSRHSGSGAAKTDCCLAKRGVRHTSSSRSCRKTAGR